MIAMRTRAGEKDGMELTHSGLATDAFPIIGSSPGDGKAVFTRLGPQPGSAAGGTTLDLPPVIGEFATQVGDKRELIAVRRVSEPREHLLGEFPQPHVKSARG